MHARVMDMMKDEIRALFFIDYKGLLKMEHKCNPNNRK
jgi:hypothetical protein